MERKAFSEYYTDCITSELLADPSKDVTTIEIDTKLSTLKPKHGKIMCDMYTFFKSEKGKDIIRSGWHASGISEAIETGRATGRLQTLDPYEL